MSDPETRSLVVERLIAHPSEKIWRALTQGPLIEEWLMANDFQPVVGHRFTFRMAPMPHWDGIVEGEVTEVEPCERLAYRWNTSGESGGLRTLVTWTLNQTANGVYVRMEQAGFRVEDENNYRGAAYGWQRYLAGLDRVAGGLA